MFVALDKNNQRVTLTGHAQAANLTHQTFHCPICKQVVSNKNGTVMPAHFAHRSQPMGEGEPESIEHLTGKWWLASWLKQHGEQATLEYYDATIRQRADLLVASKPPRVLEFQASPLSVPDLQKRTMMIRQLKLGRQNRLIRNDKFGRLPSVYKSGCNRG